LILSLSRAGLRRSASQRSTEQPPSSIALDGPTRYLLAHHG
jgi:hypothetical protein